MLQTVPLFGALPGGPEMLIILLVLVLLFGANKIPKLARSTGQAMGEFKKGREQVEEELQEMQKGEQTEAAGTEGAAVEGAGTESPTEPETATEEAETEEATEKTE